LKHALPVRQISSSVNSSPLFSIISINGKRNQGRQPKKWMDNVNGDIEAKKLTVQQATVLVWDRNKWKHQVAASSSLK